MSRQAPNAWSSHQWAVEHVAQRSADDLGHLVVQVMSIIVRQKTKQERIPKSLPLLSRKLVQDKPLYQQETWIRAISRPKLGFSPFFPGCDNAFREVGCGSADDRGA